MEMVQRGADKYRAKLGEARDKGEMTSVKAFHQKVEEMVPQMAALLKQWLTNVRLKRGQVPFAFSRLNNLDPAVVSFITIRTMLDVITDPQNTKPGLLTIGDTIGRELEYQARMEAWRAKAPDVFYGVQNAQHRATARHRKRVNIHQFNKLMRDELPWHDWPVDIKRHTGLRCIELAIQSTGAFELSQELQHPVGHRRAGRGRKKLKPQYIITLAAELQEDLMKRLDADEMRQPQYMPTLMPPKRWKGVRNGGYYTPMTTQRPLIRFRTSSGPLQREAAMQEYDALDMPRVMSALNYVQEVPWKINQRVLNVALYFWDRDLATAGFPKQATKPLPPKPDGMDGDEELIKKWKRAAAKVYGDNATRLSKATAVRTTLELAEKFRNHEFYFPHHLDFRGRMYPIPTYLQPQGNDLARGLLCFGKGVRLGEHGGYWLAVHLANHFGKDKLTLDERVQWVVDNEEMFRRIGKDPKRNREWITETGPKHYWQALAATFEWVRALDGGDEIVSALPIHIDGTCNGIQHLSAMMRDEVGGAAVNLIPDSVPHDIYGDVGGLLEERLKGINRAGGAQGHKARAWLKLFPENGKIPRSLPKKAVMTTPYGATREAHFNSIYEWLRENYEDRGRIPFGATEEESREQKKKLVPWLVGHLQDALHGKVAQGKLCMKWLQDTAKVVAECDQPIIWRTPSGFVVRHFYGQERFTTTSTLIDGKRIGMAVRGYSDKLSVKDQLRGIAPNFTHSMDASANMETINRMGLDPRGLPITAIHDAYGTCAGAMWTLFDSVRAAFIWVHQNDVLDDFRQCCVRMYRDHLLATRPDLDWPRAAEIAEETLPRIPARGELDLGPVMDSKYFFH
ncbi:MAG: hypothetical protein KGL35_19210 [Bradyrhizobium sp.]|nr:hypothetical protein [Bradyrhizobium sp.]